MAEVFRSMERPAPIVRGRTPPGGFLILYFTMYSAFGVASGPAIDAIVKWFNSNKGYGFVELADGSGDAFLHIGVLERGGHGTVLPETKLRVQVGQGQKGPQRIQVLPEGQVRMRVVKTQKGREAISVALID